MKTLILWPALLALLLSLGFSSGGCDKSTTVTVSEFKVKIDVAGSETLPPTDPTDPPPVGGTFEVNGPLPAELLTGSDWYKRIDALPAHPLSREIITAVPPLIASLGRRTQNDWGMDIGMPYSVGTGNPPVQITINAYPLESDAGPFPIPLTAPIESGSDKHLLYYDTAGNTLYELFLTNRVGDGFSCDSSAIWRRGKGDDQRVIGYTSADAAGLAITPGLVKLSEMKAALAKPNPDDQHLGHAMRYTLPFTGKGFISPARHYTSNHGAYSLPTRPPMGMRIRVKKTLDLSQFNPPTQVLLRTGQLYGFILADNGGAFLISGTMDPGWAEYWEEITGNVNGKKGFKSFAGPLFDDNMEVIDFADSEVVTQL